MNRINLAQYLLSLVCLGTIFAPFGIAAPTNLSVQINALENRFFFHHYGQDPIEKRLQRLELLMFGQTQAGTLDERWLRIKAMVAERDRKSAAELKAKNPTFNPKPDGEKAGSGHYPILNTIEWRALKKTYQSDSLDQRLERLETKIFGQASPAMAYADRVERLNRTLGIGATSKPLTSKLGPLPKAKAPQSDPNQLLPSLPPSALMPFADLPLNTGLHQRMFEMMRQMDQQMEQLMRMPPGVYRFEPDTDFGLKPKQNPLKPSNPPTVKPSPFRDFPSRQQKIPSYGDPNAI